MKKIDVDVIVLGLSHAGGFFAKEAAKLLAHINNEHMRFNMYLYDSQDVDEEDLAVSAFLPEDVEWNRAAVLGSILCSTYKSLYLQAYATDFDSHAAVTYRRDKGFYADHFRIVFDFSKDTVKDGTRELWKSSNNIQVIRPQKDGVRVYPKYAGVVKRVYRKAVAKQGNSIAESLQIARICLGILVNITENHLRDEDIPYTEYSAGEKFCNNADSWLVVCVGTGGTGGNFCKELPHLMLQNKKISLLMIDGDRVEEKNVKRQPFSGRDMMQNKAEILRKDLEIDYPGIKGRLFSCPYYMDKTEDLENAIAGCGGKYDHVLLVGGVDNHAARRVMQQYHQKQEESVYMDSANEWSNGECVIAIRSNGIDYSPVRSFYFPDVLTDNSPSVSQISCGAINESAPQHQLTNLTAAQCLFANIVPLLTKGIIHGGIAYFDAFKSFMRFQPVTLKMIKEAAYG